MTLRNVPKPKNFEQLELSDLIDAKALQEMMDDYYALTGIGIGIIDLKGNVLVSTGWQEICVNFHRKNPESLAYCLESDIQLSSGVSPGTFKTYRCKNNLWDMVTPIILGERHIGNIFLGQFLYDDEEPDYELFRQQAKQFGFDEEAYLAALDKVPRWSRKTVKHAMQFYSKLAQNLSQASYANVLLAETLHNQKHTERELLQKNTELENFTYTVSHDLKSPLITIQSYTGMIAKDMEAGNLERALSDLQRVENAAIKMTELLNNLLELSRIGKVINTPAQVDMNRLVKEALQQLAGSIQESGTSITVQENLPTVYGDQKRLAEVLQNLVENAIKYRGEPLPQIAIGAHTDNNTTVFFVRDNGMGIDPRNHETIFTLFKKLDPKSKGTGIGLALVKRIIELHGGRVWIESEGTGHGTCFCFTLPEAPKGGN